MTEIKSLVLNCHTWLLLSRKVGGCQAALVGPGLSQGQSREFGEHLLKSPEFSVSGKKNGKDKTASRYGRQEALL